MLERLFATVHTPYNRPSRGFAVNMPVNPAVLRILDANANRAREALRVVEDYARFVLDDAALSGELKQLRHDLATATAGFDGERIQ